LIGGDGGNGIDASHMDDEHLLPASTWHHDPWLAVANARRLVREGALEAAANAYQHAQSLYEEPNFHQLCHSEHRVVAMWLPGNDGRVSGDQASAQNHWSGLLRAAIRHSPDFATITEPPPNQEPRVRLCYALAAIAAGEFDRARTALGTIREDAPGDSLAAIGAELALAVIGLLWDESESTESDFSEIATKAELQGLPWISRLSNGFHRAASISPENMTWWSRSCRGNISYCEEIGDAWGAALLTAAVAISGQHCGHTDAGNEFASAAAKFRDLDAPLLQLWCELLPLRDAGDEDALRRVIESSTAMDVRSARALTSALVTNGIIGIAVPAVLHVVHTLDTLVDITCFGSFRLHIDGQPLDLSGLRPQARNVLQLLSLAPNRDHRCEFLEDVLWPGVAHSVAAHRLQVAISSVRSAVDSHGVAIERAGDKYRMSLPANARVDVVEFDELLSKASVSAVHGDLDGRIAAREQVLRLYAGDLLTDFPSTDHIDAERHRYRRSAAAAASALASDYQALGETDLAMKAAQRSVQLNPEDEAPWLIIADLHDAAGDHVGAEHVRREHAQMQAELGA
jgi:DNA-binding SARP family transcriptional activator